MRWLRDLFRGSTSSKLPRYGVAKEDPEPIDWRSIEDRLFLLAEDQLLTFAAKHKAESFYGFGFDCNSDEGQVLLCLNSRTAQYEAVRKSRSAKSELYQSSNKDDALTTIEWAFGDWKYQGFNVPSKAWSKGWRDAEAEMGAALYMLSMNRKSKAMQRLREAFLDMACRALHRLEQSSAIRSLNRDDDFRTLCADHDESVDEGFARMKRVIGFDS